MEFPRLVYKCPGPYARQGGTYDHAVVNDADEHASQTGAGWFSTLPEAIEGKPAAQEVPADDAAPTRAELEAKAKELEIAFDGRTSDAKLLAKITEALA
jgi:hypothetical protein